ncbi:hypothetical protein BDN72DRAFT_536527 [Pluteus cervinus]|uniref:Uncharacterized protein n=1 Tax=Pluteus cervinus TaxID=181527 RepID=A0ACD3A3N8_9AGAR|nr:hypothetical protein BDN72DRAFT_536527 [Pluteus cervinus]
MDLTPHCFLQFTLSTIPMNLYITIVCTITASILGFINVNALRVASQGVLFGMFLGWAVLRSYLDPIDSCGWTVFWK